MGFSGDLNTLYIDGSQGKRQTFFTFIISRLSYQAPQTLDMTEKEKFAILRTIWYNRGVRKRERQKDHNQRSQ